MQRHLRDALEIREAIRQLGIDIYQPLIDYPEALYTTDELQALLSQELIGETFDAPIRTRAKLVKAAVAAALGYPVPASFEKTKPRFPGQDLDVHAQQSNNLQIWNDEITPTRRHVVLGLDADSRVVAVRVVEGAELAVFDTTGTLTSKFQAKRRPGLTHSALVSAADTEPFLTELGAADELEPDVLKRLEPVAEPIYGTVLSIKALHRKLLELVGQELPYSPSERRRGESLHRAACAALGLGSYADSGRFPDIVCQALEVKLQLSSTIDLGLVLPTSEEPAVTLSPRLRYCDSRYMVAYATLDGPSMRIDAVVTTTGADFFSEFQQFGGLGQNKKLQLHLPNDFFDPK